VEEEVQPAAPVEVEQTTQDAVPVDANPAHTTDEDPEDHIGRKLKDPWADPRQTSWPNNDEYDVEVNPNELGSGS
jgi:hypothetical protein